MDAILILIDSDAELARARKLVERLMMSDEPADVARLAAQARLIAAYEEDKWPRPGAADVRDCPLPHGSTRSLTRGYGSDSRYREPRERSLAR